MNPSPQLKSAAPAPHRSWSGAINGESKHLVSDKVSILIVDDRADKLLALEAILSPLNQNLVKARSGKEALRHLLNQDFAVVLLDVAMPGMDGFETAALIRKRPRTEHTPIIFVTSLNHSQENVSQGYSLGAVDYILTPIIPEVLRTKVSVFVELHRKTALIQQQAEQLRKIEEQKHQRELAAVADRLEAETKRNRFFTLALDLLGIADFDGRLLQVNPAWEKTLGYGEKELKSKTGLDLVHRDDYDAMLQQFEAVKRGENATYFEARYRHKNGSYRWLGWTAAAFESEKLIYVFARDITARKAAEEEVKVLNRELERRVHDLTDINQELESFNYSISHDLRAPLRSISSFSQVIRLQSEGKLSAEANNYLSRVENAAKYMDTLLMGLLEYSRLGRAELELVPVDLNVALRDVLSSIEQEIQATQADIKVEEPLGCIVGHPATVRQVLYNLVANGLKFVAPNRHPELKIWCDRQGKLARLWVADCGIGISPQYHQQIFGLFQRLHSHEDYPGTGIGLAMVRKGVERMGGRIGLESEPDKGSRFWFELPVSEAAAAESSAGELLGSATPD